MNDNGYVLISVTIIAAVTILLRFLPFAVLRGNKKTPAVVDYLGQVLPYAIMGMLVVFCLKNTDFLSSSHGIPELAASAVTIGVHLLRRNTLLSIAAGTAAYMLLVQFVF